MPESISLDVLRESILRRIMRVACAVGALGMLLAALFVRPFHTDAALLAAFATTAVFAATLLPPKIPIVANLYPWALVITGTGLAWIMGPKPEPFLLASGGIFIGSLVLRSRQHLILVVAALLGGCTALIWSQQPFEPQIKAAWINSITSMSSVVLPAAISGRMLVSALNHALNQRETLVTRLLEESNARENALRTLKTTQAQLTHAQKVELVGQMAGGLAHDMNNALTAVMGEASLLDDSVCAERERILEATSYAAKLTHQLMVFSRRDTSQPRPIDLSTSMRGCLKAIRRVIPSEIQILSELPQSPLVVIADPTQVLQILLNLAGNARDAMVAEGTLTLSADEEIASKCARIVVSDTGAGIPPDVMPHIFEPFFTTKSAGAGTGLGLTNVRQLVEAMGGTIQVQSQPGKGTSFTIRIPTTSAPATEEPLPLLDQRLRAGNVLVVDDDVRVRAVVYTALERVGYRVLEAGSPEAALELVKRHPGGVDLLLTDVVMSGGGGAAAINLLRSAFPNLRVLVMSGYNDDETLRRGIAQGAFPFLAKPFTSDTLVRAVDKAIAIRSDSHAPSVLEPRLAPDAQSGRAQGSINVPPSID